RKIVFGAGGLAANLDHAKAAADDIGGAEGSERALEGFKIDAGDLDIEILRHHPQQPVAHAAADEAGPPHTANRLEHRAKVGRENERIHRARELDGSFWTAATWRR